ncbi:HAD-IIIA family hydrolase [Cytobacillus oceanisediminis]|uniref:HAD-IIIA family hydrolase n=1 Tax=Niallia alba TaxID=2729105 RepID=A0A7Y0PPC9_9BACI|nr:MULTISPECIES: HAD-IIIA family hydrolase [Bacillaceae]EOR24720.1 3-deoxy-D-manno-octulosonate 8-phosphate phosphatase, YrbI family protein [Niallia nealsonii AAU1]MBQ6447224.1 HAD-IIIA family hydrolase [Bacillus sp. (in: firmicutes)]MBZ9534756.1 HAD-IIIA family hydrolase [Cytobacillus oceanisediminis]NMO79321.1 HAD-IIIA family hydrolase [Niallia alba]
MRIKLIVLDVDGVLTDGRLYIGSDGNEYKAFHTQDGMGISLAKQAGIKTAIITGRKSKAVRKRAEELSFDYVFEGIHDKLETLQKIIDEIGIGFEEVCYMGDDLNDIPILTKVGWPCAPKNAMDMVKDQVMFVADSNGGDGAVREMIDSLLLQKYSQEEIVQLFLSKQAEITQ